MFYTPPESNERSWSLEALCNIFMVFNHVINDLLVFWNYIGFRIQNRKPKISEDPCWNLEQCGFLTYMTL